MWKTGVIEPDAADVDTSDGADLSVYARDPGAADAAADGAVEGVTHSKSCTDDMATPHVGHDDGCAGIDDLSTPRTTIEVPEPSKYDWAVKKTEVTAAMKQMGFAKDEARALIEQAVAELPRSASREDLVRKALHIYRHSAAGAGLAR